MALMNIGDPVSGFHYGSQIYSILYNNNNIGSSNSLNTFNHDKIIVQWTVTGLASGSVLGGNDNNNWAVLDAQNFSSAQTVLVGFDTSSVPKYMKIVVGSNTLGSFSGSVTCIMAGR